VYRVASAVFISVTVLPFTRVTVAAPFSYDPPAIPIFAEVLVNETSVKTGAEAGNEPPTVTVPAMPLTEIVACVTFTAVGFDPPVTTRLDGALLDPAFWVDAGFDEADVVLEPQPLAPEALDSAVQSEICW
jgi:hypothetical protein